VTYVLVDDDELRDDGDGLEVDREGPEHFEHRELLVNEAGEQ